MQEVFEKILEKLNSKKAYFQRFYECEGKSEHDADLNKSTQLAFDDAIEIVKQEAEKYNKDWIPCSERLPSDCANREVTAQLNNGKLYTELAYYDEARKEWWNHDGLLNVIAWKESSEPYQPKGEK